MKKNIIYDKLKEVIERIRETYEDPEITIAGDFNDDDPKNQFENLKISKLRNYSRFNDQGRKNTNIDYIYSNEKI